MLDYFLLAHFIANPEEEGLILLQTVRGALLLLGNERVDLLVDFFGHGAAEDFALTLVIAKDAQTSLVSHAANFHELGGDLRSAGQVAARVAQAAGACGDFAEEQALGFDAAV